MRLILAMFLLLASCGEKERSPYPTPGILEGTGSDKELPESQILNLTPVYELNQDVDKINSHKGETKRSHLCRDFRYHYALPASLTGGKAVYPRITRSADGLYIMTYHLGNSTSNAGNEISMLTSTDLLNWKYHGVFNGYESITDDFGYSNKRAFAGANVLTLANGDILYSVSFRALHGYGGHFYGDNHNSSGILIRKSKDSGKSWDKGKVVFTGMNWETHMVQLPSGDVHCYFTNSSERLNLSEWPNVKNNVAVGCVVSKDNGETWEFVGNVVRQKRDYSSGVTLFTDQMPVVIALNETGELAGAFESMMAKATVTGASHCVSLAYSGNAFEYPVLNGTEVGPKDRVSDFCTGAGPFIVQFPSGETVLSYNKSNYFYTRMGDETGRNFGSESRSLDKKGFWGCMYVDGSHRMLASIGGNSSQEMDFGVFYLNHNIKAVERICVLDGSNAEWKKTDHALFVGSKSLTQATLRVSSDKENIYFLVETFDEKLNAADNLTIYLSSKKDTKPGSSSVRIEVGPAGLNSSAVYDGAWKQEDLGVEAESAVEGTADNKDDKDCGWLCELKVPKISLKGLADGELIVNMSLFDMLGGSEVLADETSLSEWPVIYNL